MKLGAKSQTSIDIFWGKKVFLQRYSEPFYIELNTFLFNLDMEQSKLNAMQ